MSLNDQQRKFYENTLTVTKQEISDLDRQIEDELAKVKEKLAQLQNAKKAARQMISRTQVNKSRRSRVKTDVRSVEEAIASGDRAKAEAALKAAQPPVRFRVRDLRIRLGRRSKRRPAPQSFPPPALGAGGAR